MRNGGTFWTSPEMVVTVEQFASWSEWKTYYAGKVVGFEWEFVRLVLQEVQGLKPSWVTPQREFVSNEGRTLHMDFAIETPKVRIAIELEGYDKTGNGQGQTRREHDRGINRFQSLTAQNWQLLPITNAQFKRNPVKIQLDIARRIDPENFVVRHYDSVHTETAPTTIGPAAQSPINPAHDAGGVVSPKKNVWPWVFVIIAALAIIWGVSTSTNSGQNQTPSTNVEPADKDCPDFTSQLEAQEWFDKYFPDFGDIGRLDRDGDGRVCTSTKYKN